MVKTLSTQETQEVLARHPEIRADEIPTYGVEIIDSNRRLLVGIRHATGEIVIFDISAYDEQGNLLNETEAEIKAKLWDVWGIVDPYGRRWAGSAEMKRFSDAVICLATYSAKNIVPIAIGIVAVYVALELAKLWKTAR